MTNPFKDQTTFMNACGQTTDKWHRAQFEMYLDLIREEHSELTERSYAN